MAVDKKVSWHSLRIELISNRFFEFTRRNILLCIIIIAAAASLGLTYAILTPPKYKSRLTFSLDTGNDGNAISGAAGIASQLGFDIGGSSTMFSDNNIIEILRSRKIIEDVLLSEYNFKKGRNKLVEYFLNEMGLRKKSSIHPIIKKTQFPLGLKKPYLDLNQSFVLKEIYSIVFKEHLYVQRPDKNLNIFQVSVESWDEEFSKIFTDKLISATDSFYKEVCTRKSANTLALLESRVDEYKKNLHSSIDSKSKTMDADINPAFATTVAPIEKEVFDIRLYGESYSELFKNLEIARFQYHKDMPLLQIIDAADYPMDIVEVNRFYATLAGGFTGIILFMLISLIFIIVKPMKKE